jgi:hypothetical protein
MEAHDTGSRFACSGYPPVGTKLDSPESWLLFTFIGAGFFVYSISLFHKSIAVTK